MTCADPARLDLVLCAAVRRIGTAERITVFEPLVTRSMPAGGGQMIKPSAFAALDDAGAIVLSWNSAGRQVGYTAGLLDQLAGGAIVVAGAGCETESAARALWHDVRIVRLQPGTETLRAALSPHHCMARSTAGTSGLGRLLAETCDVLVRDHGDPAAAIRDLTAAIELQLPPPVRASAPALDHAATSVTPAEVIATAHRTTHPLRQRVGRPPQPAARAPKPHARAATPT